MIFCIFSYNRGRFLESCLRSIERCVDHPVIAVFDDDSDDPETVEILTRLGTRHQIVAAGPVGNGKHGGLYQNMQQALERFADADLVCFLQDDMQVLRTIDRLELDEFHRYFLQHPQAGFLQPCFLKGATRERDSLSLRYSRESGIYQRHASKQSAGVHYSDTFITSPSRLLAKGWRFASSEPANDRQASRHFDRMGHLFAPFAMWLPEVPAFRGKRKTWALRTAERQRRCGFHPFESMSEAQAVNLKQRSPDILPFAEDFLTCGTPGLPQPWSYYPLQDRRWLKKLNSWEIFLRRLSPF